MGNGIVGRTGKPFVIEVERGKIREFARATKSRNPAHLEGERPVSPPTYLMVADHWITRENLPWGDEPRNLARILHAEQEFVFHGEPPRAGDRLTGQARIDRQHTKEGRRGGTMTFTDVVWEYRDANGRHVADVRFTQVETAHAPKED